jgi:hypothetical protein
MSYLYVADIVNWVQMRTWKEVPAIILSAGLDTSSSSGRTHSRSRSTVYKALAEYQYEYQGKTYRSTKVSRYFGSDNIGKFYENIYAEISRYQKSQERFRCYVNPDSPDEAILYRDMRLGMLCLYGGFGGIFGGIGWGFLVGSVASYLRNQSGNVLQKQFPNEPWKWRKDWIRGEARTDAGNGMFVAVAFSIFAAIFSIPILLFIPSALMKGDIAAALALIYPFGAAFVIKWGIGSLLRWIRFGRAVLQLHSIPIRPGERLRGTIHTGGRLPESARVRLELVRLKKGSPDPQWTHSITTTPSAGSDGKTFIQVDIEIPEQTKKSSQLEWELRALSEIPGIDLDAAFKIPVFQNG